MLTRNTLASVLTHVGAGSLCLCCCPVVVEPPVEGGGQPGAGTPDGVLALDRFRRERDRPVAIEPPVVGQENGDRLLSVQEEFSDRPTRTAERSPRLLGVPGVRPRRMRAAAGATLAGRGTGTDIDAALALAFQKFLRQEELDFMFILLALADDDCEC